VRVLAAALAAIAVASGARAQESSCPPVADLAALVRCAQRSSEAVVRARAELDAARARRDVASRLLPANPALEVGAGRRTLGDGATDVDRSIELSQQIELGGQRGARIDAAEAELRAARASADAVERLVAADVLTGAARVVKDRQALSLVREQREATLRLAEVSGARARKGVAAPFESELAEAARIQALREERAAALELAEAERLLAAAAGADVQLAAGASLPPVSQPRLALAEMERNALEHEPEAVAARNEIAAAQARAALLRRERIPDLTIAAGYKHEEQADVIGGRLSIPLPLFRRNQGEIAEQEARSAQATARSRQIELRVRLSLRAAYGSWQRAQDAVKDIPANLEDRLRADVESLRRAYERGTLQLPLVLASLREVQSARRTVLDARAEAVLASIELARAAALSPCPEGGCR
jgi:outer membrane protein, heavy metal efflux system